MTTPQNYPASAPSKKPPAVPPKPVFETPEPAEDQIVQNGGFHKKLEIFERIAQTNQVETEKDKETEYNQETYQTRTIRRRTKTKDRENKNYERLNVSPVRRRPSHPTPALAPWDSVTGKRRVESDPDQTLIIRDTDEEVEVFDSDVRMRKGSDGSNSHQGSKLGKEKPAPPPKKSYLTKYGTPSTTAAGRTSSSENESGEVTKAVQSRRSSDGHENLRAKSGQHNVNTKTVSHSRPEDVGMPREKFVKTEKGPKPAVQAKPKLAPRAVSQAVNTNRISVLDMIGNFENKNNTRTLGRVTKKKKVPTATLR